jgi:hypothetical protein
MPITTVQLFSQMDAILKQSNLLLVFCASHRNYLMVEVYVPGIVISPCAP